MELYPPGTGKFWDDGNGLLPCHLETPNTSARADAIHAGEFGNANTATLLGLNIVEQSARWIWQRDPSTKTGELKSDALRNSRPRQLQLRHMSR